MMATTEKALAALKVHLNPEQLPTLDNFVLMCYSSLEVEDIDIGDNR